MKIEKKYIHISAGRGPAECCWVVAQYLKFLKNHCEKNSINTRILDRHLGPENGTLASALIEISGKNLDTVLKDWIGPVQWIGQSPFRKFHKRKNWFIAVQWMNAPKINSMDMKAVRFETFRSSGPGGQHRNKVETAVRCIHIPTGTCAMASDSKSQSMNKKNALQKLELTLAQKREQELKQFSQNQWEQHTDIRRGNPVCTFEGKKFTLINQKK